MAEFANKVVLITGAGQGLGRQLAMVFSTLGACIATNDINPMNVDDTVSQIHLQGGQAEGFVFDIAKRMPVEAMVAQVMDCFGHIDILVNHASVWPSASVLTMDEWEFHRTIDVNLAGPFFAMQQVGRVMQQQGGGSIVNLLFTHEPSERQTGHAAYIASQAGMVGLTQAAANELSVHRIRVNAICQASFGFETLPSQGWDVSGYHNWLLSNPVLNSGDYPMSISLVVYLCSRAAESVTGQVITVQS